jgi:pimeloyl-ACP methyl ester carboxylesterase
MESLMTIRFHNLTVPAVLALALFGSPVAAQTSKGAGTPALYAAYAGQSVEAGEWLGSEPLPPSLGLVRAGRQLRFVYGSTDGVDGDGTVVVSGAVFLPAGEPPAGGWPVVAWAHGTVGVADHCAPSVAGRSSRDLEYLGAWLGAGHAIVATDYQGLGTPGPHPYLNNRAAAYSVLDAVRAARRGVPGLADRVLIVGQSQGAAAAISTAAYAPAYAPELRVVGTVATGVPNPEASLSRANQAARDAEAFDPAVAYLLYLAVSAAERDPSLSPAGAVQDRAMAAYAAAADLCARPMLEMVQAGGLTQVNAFTPAFVTVYADAIRPAAYPGLALSQPLFVGVGERDIDTPAAGQLEIVRDACRAGTLVEAHLYAGGDHSSTVNPSFRDSVVFARKALAGEGLSAECSPAAQPLEGSGS